MDTIKSTISLLINNDQLESGIESFCIIDHQGGTIGSDPNSTWFIQDVNYTIPPQQALIRYEDGAFCLFPQATLKLNGASFNINNPKIKLQTGDRLSVGLLDIKITVNSDGIDKTGQMRFPPEHIISHYTNPMDEILAKNSSHDGSLNVNRIAETVDGAMTADPLKVLEGESLTINSNLDSVLSDNPNHLLAGTEFNPNNHTTLPGNSILSTPFMELPHSHSSIEQTYSSGYQFMDQKAEHQNFSHPISEEAYVGLNPLLKGVSNNLEFTNSKQVYDFLETIGKTVNATIQGLLEVQAHLNIADTQLRPLEDNPLRLGQSYESTIDLLYSQAKSPVHLSAPSAVAETLSNVILHQKANSIAISEALKVLLSAFSPGTLESRFKKYRPMHDEPIDQDGNWSWAMYKNYYQELISSRQQGFEKLFQEVYSQVYDRELRRLQQEIDE